MLAVEVFVGVLLALMFRDIIRWYAAKLDWRWSVNKLYIRGVPLRLQLVRALQGKLPKYGEG